MRIAAIIFVMIAVSACRQEPSFNTQYDETRAKLEAKARELDNRLDAADNMANATSRP